MENNGTGAMFFSAIEKSEPREKALKYVRKNNKHEQTLLEEGRAKWVKESNNTWKLVKKQEN